MNFLFFTVLMYSLAVTLSITLWARTDLVNVKWFPTGMLVVLIFLLAFGNVGTFQILGRATTPNLYDAAGAEIVWGDLNGEDVTLLVRKNEEYILLNQGDLPLTRRKEMHEGQETVQKRGGKLRLNDLESYVEEGGKLVIHELPPKGEPKKYD